MARQSWLDDESQQVLIDDYVQKLSSFIEAMADGVVDQAEVAAQEQRLIAAIKEVEPELDDQMHGKVTRLLCELSAYNILQLLHTMHAARATSQFRG